MAAETMQATCSAYRWAPENPFNREAHQCGRVAGHSGSHRCKHSNGVGRCRHEWGDEDKGAAAPQGEER